MASSEQSRGVRREHVAWRVDSRRLGPPFPITPRPRCGKGRWTRTRGSAGSSSTRKPTAPRTGSGGGSKRPRRSRSDAALRCSPRPPGAHPPCSGAAAWSCLQRPSARHPCHSVSLPTAQRATNTSRSPLPESTPAQVHLGEANRERAVAAEVKLKPGWLTEDVRKASDRLNEWAASRNDPRHATSGDRNVNAPADSRDAPDSSSPRRHREPR